MTLTRTTLPNGLRVFLQEMHTAPLISQWLWFKTGSRDEAPGRTGASHWVEHMLFKGTPRFPGGLLDKAISRQGGYWNAMTYLDWTTYYETMPAAQIDLALELEADRFTNATFLPADVESERTVILSERQGNENSPLFKLDEAIQNAAYKNHGYHHEVIGHTADLQSMTRDDLYDHYRTHYVPANAVLALSGDFETGPLLERIRELYEPIPAAPEPPRPHRPEPEPEGEQRLTVEGPGETAFVHATYRAPHANDPDFHAHMVLDSLLTGPSNLNMFGGGISNKTSLLYQTLVDGEIAVSIAGGLQATLDPFLYTLHQTVHPARTPEEAIAALDEQIDAVQASAPSEAEVARAVKQARALFAYGSESISNQAFWLGFSEMLGGYEWFETYLDRLAAVTPADVQRAAQTWLAPHRRIIGTYIPDGRPLAEGEDE
ncbi:MAG: insulinase family protein [Anaerolineae bacterium]|nr:MAG: insulinase family protein [Anaerolineae bacterium]